MKCYLRIGGDSIEDSSPCESISDAVGEYRRYVEDVLRFQDTADEAAIHIPDNDKGSVAARPNPRDRLCDYPDYVLSVGPRGGIRKERA
jgi:hypothetical protein